MGDHSIYISFDDPNKRESRMWVYAGRAASKNKAISLAYKLMHEEGGGVEQVRIINWNSQVEFFIRRIGSEDDGPDEAA